MRIEVVSNTDAPAKDKGDLLERIAGTLLKTQSYEIKEQVRLTACELDLLCVHPVSGRTIYVECKAHRENLSANALKNLLGTITLKGFDEGWLISTGPFGKDANGFLVEWEQKPIGERSKLSIYTPARVLEALQNAHLVCSPPIREALSLLKAEDRIGEWSLLVTPWGNFWACPCLENGVPLGVALYDSKKGLQITDKDLLGRISRSDTTLSSLAFDYANAKTSDTRAEEGLGPAVVVEVEFGESWTDYRPARPEHFVGRTKIQKEILQFLAIVKRHDTETRVFAIKGDSGIGKSSLIAKLRDRAKRSKKPSNLFLFAVDMRAANDPGYVQASLLESLRNAARSGFGSKVAEDLRITDYSDPLNSESIKQFLQECARHKQVIVLVFDQFEELYTKPELFAVFDETRRLMFSTVSAGTSLVLGFAWKTDTTIPQDHPAYYMWHQLSDHRYEVALSPFTHTDAVNSIRMFEMELGDRIRPELRRYLIENSQGYPWLLKKFCIHLYEQLQAGATQVELADRSLDIEFLFDRDLQRLTTAQDACLKLVAKNAPMDWYEVLATTGAEVVRSLQEERLLIRRGDKLNIYWDIFREYVLTGSIPQIPFTHVPQSPSLGALLKVAFQLDHLESKTIEQLSSLTDLSVSTVRNILHDLSVFGVTSGDKGSVLLDKHIENKSPRNIMAQIRVSFRRHALTELLKEHDVLPQASLEDMIKYLKQINPAAKHHSRTWRTYAKRMGQWLTTAGYLKEYENGWVYEDCGEVKSDLYHPFYVGMRQRKKSVVFIADAPPNRVVEALDFVKRNGAQSLSRMKSLGYRNACSVLFRFRLLERTVTRECNLSQHGRSCDSAIDSVWTAAQNEPTLTQVIDFLKLHPTASAASIGRLIAEEYDRDWKHASLVRVGNALRQWAGWLMAGQQKTEIPEPPGHFRNDRSKVPKQGLLFDVLNRGEEN